MASKQSIGGAIVALKVAILSILYLKQVEPGSINSFSQSTEWYLTELVSALIPFVIKLFGYSVILGVAALFLWALLQGGFWQHA